MFSVPRRARLLLILAAGLTEAHRITTVWTRRPADPTHA